MRIPGLILCTILFAFALARAETRTPLAGPYSLGAPVTVGNLTVWPVYSKEKLAIGEFLTLQEAEKAGVVVIREKRGPAGEGQQRQYPVLLDDIVHAVEYDLEPLGQADRGQADYAAGDVLGAGAAVIYDPETGFL